MSSKAPQQHLSGSSQLTPQAFHINIAHDSRVNLDNSRSVRLISIVGLIFIPFSAITSVFGTQFFSNGDGRVNVSPDFWILWLIAIPVTALSLVAWRVTEGDLQPRPLGFALLDLPRCWSGARKWISKSKKRKREEQGQEAIELRDAASQLV